MKRSAFGTLAPALGAAVVGFTVAACIIQPSPTPHVPPAQPAEQQRASADQGPSWLNPGDYACSLRHGEYEYRPFRCVVYNVDGGQMLEKLEGSQRFRGRVLPARGGFRFDGTFYCPYGDCTEDISGDFTALDDGMYRAELRGQSANQMGTVVTLQYMPSGFTYGGMTYGGRSYGGAQGTPPPPSL